MMNRSKHISLPKGVKSTHVEEVPELHISAETISLLYVRNPLGWLWHMYQWYQFMLRKGLSHDRWCLIYDNRVGFFNWLVPLVITGRFLNRLITIQYIHYGEMERLEQPSPITRLIFRQVAHILVSNAAQVKRLTDYGISASLVPVMPMIKMKQVARNDQLQPRLFATLPAEALGNIEALLNAFTLVKQKYPRTELTIASEGTLYPSWKKFVADRFQNGLRLIPMEDVTAEDFETAQIYLHATHLPMVTSGLVTAFMSGLPVVASPFGYSQATQNGTNVLLVDYHSPAGFVDCIQAIIERDGLRETMSTQGSLLGRSLTSAS